MKFDFYYQGWVRGAEIEHFYNDKDEEVDISGLTVEQVSIKLNEGELRVKFEPHLPEYVEEEHYLKNFVRSRYDRK